MRQNASPLTRAVVIAAAVFALPGLAWSENRRSEPPVTTCPICRRASDNASSYSTKAGSTLARGVANTLFGWTELIRQPAQEVKGGGNVAVGMGKGFVEGAKRTMGGLGELFTFWTPKVQHGYIHFAHDCPLCMKRQQP